MTPNCPFCEIQQSLVNAANAAAVAIRDAFPVARGHTLVVPRNHISSIFSMTDTELSLLWQLVAEVRSSLAEQLSPDGFNIGLNDGEAAGQTVPHAHVHIIPRYSGDVADPRGGIRWVMPEQAPYWEQRE